MIYSSPEFFVFFALLLAAYLALPGRESRFRLLLAASLGFFAWFGNLDLAVFAGVVLVSWLATWLSRKFPAQRHACLRAGIVLMAGNLFFWKYSAWACENVQALFPAFLGGRVPRVPFPIGISFFTLQGIAYLIDLGNDDVEYLPLARYALFKSFFAQLVAGPIVRARQLVPQLEALATPTARDLALGASLFTLGFLKKTLVADQVSTYVDAVFAAPFSFGRLGHVVALLGYAVQLWGDFSGYTDMGRGAARMLGIELPENFLSPYLSRTPSEYWSRWHMTLGQWIKDYIFTPLALSYARTSAWRLFLVVLVTMFAVGLWHGANWTFVVYALYHGGLLVLERKLKWSRLNKSFRARVPRTARNVLLASTVFTATLVSYIPFRAPSLAVAKMIVISLVRDLGRSPSLFEARYVIAGVAFCALSHGLFYYSFETRRWPVLEAIRARVSPWIERGSALRPAMAGAVCGLALAIAVLAAIALRPEAGVSPFIYFAF